jgi:hypothetical protein
MSASEAPDVNYLHDDEQGGALWRLLGEIVTQFLLHSVGGVRHVVFALHHVCVELHS